MKLIAKNDVNKRSLIVYYKKTRSYLSFIVDTEKPHAINNYDVLGWSQLNQLKIYKNHGKQYIFFTF